MTEGVLKNRFDWGKKHPESLAAFVGAILCGFAAHGMGLLNKFSWHDDIVSLFHVGTTISSGRWMLHVLEWLETRVFPQGPCSLPLLHGMFSIACVGLAAALLTELLQIRKTGFAAGLGGMMVVFPVMTGFFGYVFTMPYYLLSMLMTVVSAFLICRKSSWWMKMAAILLGGCAVGIYQAFIPLLVSIPLLYDIYCLSDRKESLPSMGKRVLIQGACVLGIMAFYFAMNRFFLAKFQLELNSYMGINQIDSIPLETYLARVGKAYREFFFPIRNVAQDMYPAHAHLFYQVMVCADAGMAVRLILLKGREDKAAAAVLAVFFALVPLGCNLIIVMSEKVHGLMTYGQVMQMALFIWLAERQKFRHGLVRRAFSVASAGILALMGITYIRFDNQCYLKTAFQQQQAISYYTTLVTQIRSAEGYRQDLPVVFLNGGEISDRTLYNMEELDFIHLDSYGSTTPEYINSYAWYDFMKRWCGFDPPYGDAAEWADHPAVRNMPHYPDDGSIRRVEDVILVNF